MFKPVYCTKYVDFLSSFILYLSIKSLLGRKISLNIQFFSSKPNLTLRKSIRYKVIWFRLLYLVNITLCIPQLVLLLNPHFLTQKSAYLNCFNYCTQPIGVSGQNKLYIVFCQLFSGVGPPYFHNPALGCMSLGSLSLQLCYIL